MKIIKLYFESPVHFGEKRLSESKITFSADTLFSALIIMVVMATLAGLIPAQRAIQIKPIDALREE